MTNQYKEYLNHFFHTLLYYRHINGRINKVLKKEIEIYRQENSKIHLASALVISDWTGPTDNGWEINFHTGVRTETSKDTYEIEIKKIFYRQLCLLYAQSYESFETYLKDCLFQKIEQDKSLREYTMSLLPKSKQAPFNREKMPGGYSLFKILKKAGGQSFKNFTSKNNLNVRFSELWNILSEVRHSVTHSKSYIQEDKISKSQHHIQIFNFLFNSVIVDDKLRIIELDYQKFERLIKRFSEFAFQIFKILNIEENLEWNIEKKGHSKQ
jgi:hypothetical protein